MNQQPSKKRITTIAMNYPKDAPHRMHGVIREIETIWRSFSPSLFGCSTHELHHDYGLSEDAAKELQRALRKACVILGGNPYKLDICSRIDRHRISFRHLRYLTSCLPSLVRLAEEKRLQQAWKHCTKASDRITVVDLAKEYEISISKALTLVRLRNFLESRRVIVDASIPLGDATAAFKELAKKEIPLIPAIPISSLIPRQARQGGIDDGEWQQP
jgi:hypothetical protein